MLDQNRAPLAEAVRAQNQLGNTSFHVPGHKGKAVLYPDAVRLLGEELFHSDYTEIDGLDVLHHPTGVILEAEKLAADLFGAERTWFLVNGTTSGIVAAVAAVSGPDGVVLVERACHTSVTSGLVMSGATPYYLREEYDEDAGLPAGVPLAAVEHAFANCVNVQAVVLTNPSYYGTYSDLREIVRIAHEHGAAVIVDEAHGPQLMFTGQGIPSAMESGADICIQSTHKMMGSLTQTAMLHCRGTLADPRRLQYFINLVTTTSPSYPLMVSLDEARRTTALEGKRIWHENLERVEKAAERINRIPGLQCILKYRSADGELRSVEKSRLLIDALQLGIPGTELSGILRNRFHIDAEFADTERVVLVTGCGTGDDHMVSLIRALENIAAENESKRSDVGNLPDRGELSVSRSLSAELFRLPVKVEITPRDAVTAPLELLEPDEAEGCVSARDVAVYPPGIPVLRPGELISREIIDYISEAKAAGLAVHGLIEEGEGYRLAAAQDRQKAMIFGCYF